MIRKKDLLRKIEELKSITDTLRLDIKNTNGRLTEWELNNLMKEYWLIIKFNDNYFYKELIQDWKLIKTYHCFSYNNKEILEDIKSMIDAPTITKPKK